MRTLEVLYVHGYDEQENSESSKVLKEVLSKLKSVEVVAPNIPYMNPTKAIRVIKQYADEADLVFATGIGAFYTAQITGVYKILFNMALPKDLTDLVNDKMIEELEDEFYHLCYLIDDDLKRETYLLFGDHDNRVNNEADLIEVYGEANFKTVEAPHSLSLANKDSLRNTLKDILWQIDF